MGKEGGGRGSSIGVVSRGLAGPGIGFGRGLGASIRSAGISPGLSISKTIGGESGGSFLKSNSSIFGMPKYSIGENLVPSDRSIPGNLAFKNTVILATGGENVPKAESVVFKVRSGVSKVVEHQRIKRSSPDSPTVLFERRSGNKPLEKRHKRWRIRKSKIREGGAESIPRQKERESNQLKRLETAVERFKSFEPKLQAPRAVQNIKVEAPIQPQNPYLSSEVQKVLQAYGENVRVVPKVDEAGKPKQEVGKIKTEQKVPKIIVLGKNTTPQVAVEIRKEVEEAVAVYKAAGKAGITKPELVAARALQQSLKTKGLEKELEVLEEEQIASERKPAPVKPELPVPPKIEEKEKEKESLGLIPVVDERAQKIRTEIAEQIEGEFISEGRLNISAEEIAVQFDARGREVAKCELAGTGTDGSLGTIVFDLAKEKEIAAQRAGSVIAAKIKRYPGVKVIKEDQGGKKVRKEDVDRIGSKTPGIRPTI